MKTGKDVKLKTIGSTEYVEIAGVRNVPAKIDTGADSSAIWASNIRMSKDGILTFFLFTEDSPFYTGEMLEAKNYTASAVKSSTGEKQIRYRVEIPVVIGGKKINTVFTLADRSKNAFPVLIGRHALENAFVVDVSKSAIPRKSFLGKGPLNKKLQQDAYDFHNIYIEGSKK